MEDLWLVFIGLFLLYLVVSFFIKLFGEIKPHHSSVSENSFQRFAKFYGETIPSDAEFNEKVNKICSLINDGERDITKIAELSSCTEAECIFKIKYLKNKRMIEDFNINTFKMRLYTMSPEDEKLVKKYSSFIYGSHPQIDVMAHVFANQENKTVEEEKEIVFNELKYLDSKNLLNGIKINEVDRKIIYYSVEKKKTTNLKTVHCPNCGALNDVDDDSKIRCNYCNTIIEGEYYHD